MHEIFLGYNCDMLEVETTGTNVQISISDGIEALSAYFHPDEARAIAAALIKAADKAEAEQ